MMNRLLLYLEKRYRDNPQRAARHISRLKRDTLKELQGIKLRKVVEHAYKNSLFFRGKLKEARVAPSEIRRPEDLRKLPFTTPEELLHDPYRFLCVPSKAIAHVFTSTGTTGEPKKVLFTREDLEQEIKAIAAGMVLKGAGEGSVSQIMFSYGRPSWAVGYVMQRAVESIGGLAIPAGDTLEPREQIKMMKEFHPRVLMSTASYLHRITEEASKNYELGELGVKTIILAAEPWPESLRKKLEDVWQARVYDGYGLAEMGFGLAMECDCQDGLHLDEVDFLMEVVNPETGESLEDGEEGELIFTTLSREGMPLIRYRSHDICSVIEGDCRCGLPLRRIARIKGRTDGMVIIGSGENIYQTSFDEVMFKVPEIVDYQVIIEKDGYRDKLIVRAEVSEKNEEIAEKITAAFYQIPHIKKDIEESGSIAPLHLELLAPGTLPKLSLKVNRIIDKRKLYPNI